MTHLNIRPDEIAGDNRLAAPAGTVPATVCREKILGRGATFDESAKRGTK
jgi:hypothetical protein